MTLIECLVYISVLFVVLAVAGAAYARVLDHARQVRRVAADISRALDAGERWRAEVRAATAPLRLVQEPPQLTLQIPLGELEVAYRFDGSNVLRRAASDRDWSLFLRNVKATRFVEDRREHTTAWRWEVELATRQPARVPPLFTFSATPRPQPAP